MNTNTAIPVPFWAIIGPVTDAAIELEQSAVLGDQFLAELESGKHQDSPDALAEEFSI